MKKLICIVLIIWISPLSYSQTSDKKAKDLTRDMANQLLKNSNMPGISIAISKQGKIVFAEGFGYADIANKIPVTTTTQFRTASVAK